MKLEPLIAAEAKAHLRTAAPGIRGGSGLPNSAKAIDTRAEIAKVAGIGHDGGAGLWHLGSPEFWKPGEHGGEGAADTEAAICLPEF